MKLGRMLSLAFLFSFAIFLGGAGFLAFVQHSHRAALHASPMYQEYIAIRGLLLRRPPFVTLLMFAAFGIYVGLRPKEGPIDQIGRIWALTMAFSIPLVLILVWLFRF